MIHVPEPISVEKTPITISLPLETAVDLEKIGDEIELTLKLKLIRRDESEHHNCATYEVIEIVDEEE